MNVILLAKEGPLRDVIKLRILKWRDYTGLSGWALNVITRILIEGGRGRFEHTQGQSRVNTGQTGI